MRKLAGWLPWLGSGIFSVGLGLYAYLGFFNRFWADDWCYNADLQTLGFLGTLKGYTFITHYASNRLSLTFFTLLMQQWGVFSAQITALLVVLLWFGALFLLLWGLNQFFRLNLNPALIILVTLAIEYYSLYLAPNQFRSLYFRSSVLTYSAPLIVALTIFGLLLWQMNRTGQSRELIFLMAPLAFVAGEFSEGSCAYLGAALGIFWLVVVFEQRGGQVWAKRVFSVATVALVFAALATVVLVLSPAIGPRHVGYPEPTNPLLLAPLSILFTLDFIQSSIRGLIIPHAIFALLFLLIPFLGTLTGENLGLPFAKSLRIILVIAVVAVLLIAASQIPAIYIEKGPPASKALIAARFTLLFAVAAICWLLGAWLAARLKPGYGSLAMLLMLVPLLYTVRPIASSYADLPRFVERAAVWDARDQSIRAAKDEGILQIDVRGIDSKYMGQTLDFKEKPTFWVNACAETVYGMQEIRATLP